MIVVARDRDVFGDAQPARAQDAIDLERHLVVAAAEDGGRFGESAHPGDRVPEKLGLTGRAFEFAGRDEGGIVGQARLGQRGAVAVAAQDGGGKRAEQRQITDAAVTGGDEAARKVEHAAPVVGQDSGRACLVETVGQNEGRARGDRRQAHFLMVFGDVDQPFDAVAQEGVDERGHPVETAAGIGDHQGHLRAREGLLDTLHDDEFGKAGGFGAFGHRDGAGDQADETRAGRAHHPGGVGGDIAQLVHRGLDGLALVRADRTIGIQDAADSLGRDARKTGDVIDRGHCSPLPASSDGVVTGGDTDVMTSVS